MIVKKWFVLVLLLTVPLLAMGSMYGCSQGTSSSCTTTTLSAAATAGDTAQAAVKAATGVAQTSQSTGSLAGTDTSISSISGVKDFSEPSPPDAFFSALPSNGWITIEGNTFVTGETVQVRMYTKGGEAINGTFLASKKIATLEGYSWQSMATGGFNFSTFASKANT